MGAGAGGAAGGGAGRAARALRLLLLLVMALAAVEYLFGSILDASPLKTYIYTPIYNATPAFRSRERAEHHTREKPSPPFPKRLQATPEPEIAVNRTKNDTVHKNTPETTQKPVKQEAPVSDRIDDTLLITKIMDGIKNLATTEESDLRRSNDSLPLCEVTPPDLGPVTVNKTELELVDVEKKYPEVYWGGYYSPPNCTARHKVAIIVPYRDRQQHLAMFLNHMHPLLMKQQLEYGIFIIEQEGASAFNRAKLFNVGFMESNRLKSGGWQCFIFHDVDLLPLDTRNLYSCPKQPRHMSAAVDKHKFRLLYEDLFGGVSAMTFEQFTKVNGFSNKYWGWGAEDDDMAYRLKKKGYHIARYAMSIARYAMLDHKPAAPNPKRYQLLSQASKNFKKDGLSTLKYELIGAVQHHLFTQITVNIDENS